MPYEHTSAPAESGGEPPEFDPRRYWEERHFPDVVEVVSAPKLTDLFRNYGMEVRNWLGDGSSANEPAATLLVTG